MFTWLNTVGPVATTIRHVLKFNVVILLSCRMNADEMALYHTMSGKKFTYIIVYHKWVKFAGLKFRSFHGF